MKTELRVTKTAGARVTPTGTDTWRLEIPAGGKGRYRVAQLDDYSALPRRAFPWRAPFHMRMRARAGSERIPGTWGFGLWNNPFGMAILSGVELLRLPTLPNTAWFFFASPENHLSLRDDLPAHGSLAAAFRSPRLPAPLLLLGAPALPLFLLPPAVRLLRRLGRSMVRQDAAAMDLDPVEWHTYGLDWKHDGVTFQVDGATVFETPVAPLGPLGIAIWVDNQYAALPPTGRISFGTLPNPEPAWIEIEELEIG